MKLDVKWNSGLNFQSDSPSGHTIQFDSGPKDVTTAGPTPMELVLQSAAVCSGMDVVSILEKRRKKILDFQIEVDAERSEDHPKIFTKIDLTYLIKSDDITLEEVEKAVKLSMDKYCSVAGMLRNNVEINWKCELNS